MCTPFDNHVRMPNERKQALTGLVTRGKSWTIAHRLAPLIWHSTSGTSVFRQPHTPVVLMASPGSPPLACHRAGCSCARHRWYRLAGTTRPRNTKKGPGKTGADCCGRASEKLTVDCAAERGAKYRPCRARMEEPYCAMSWFLPLRRLPAP